MSTERGYELSEREMQRTTSDLLIDLDIFQPQTLSVGDWNLEFDIWEDRLLREFAEVCPTPNTFEELMLADALDMPDEAILYWFEHYRQKRRRLLAAENAGADIMRPRPELKTQKEISAHMQTLKDKYCFRHALRKVTLKKKASWPEVMHDLV
uniref:Homeobox domain-containing protein n=1 Tax=Elsinoe australis TaxID=40998 RepID=A0A7D6ESL6_9PEZI|nr:hypothetical protein [Elsinoe australis]